MLFRLTRSRIPLDNPGRLAAEFVAAMGERVLRYHQGEFLEYLAGITHSISDECVRGELTVWLEIELKRMSCDQLAVWTKAKENDELSAKELNQPPTVRPVTVAIVNNVSEFRGLGFPEFCEIAAWIDRATGPNPGRIISMNNGLLSLDAAVAKAVGCLSPPRHHSSRETLYHSSSTRTLRVHWSGSSSLQRFGRATRRVSTRCKNGSVT